MLRLFLQSTLLAAALWTCGGFVLSPQPAAAQCSRGCCPKPRAAAHAHSPAALLGKLTGLGGKHAGHQANYAAGLGQAGAGGPLADHRALKTMQRCRPQQYGQPDLFYNFYVPPTCGGIGAEMYLAPHPVPPLVGHTYYTYQPLMPHEMLYRHHRTYHRYYANGRGLTRTSVIWW